MKIYLGKNLDGYRPPSKKNLVGEIYLGPLGLLRILEIRLGLGGMQVSQSRRVAEYLKCLYEADDEKRFYSASLAVDEIAVANTLLSWRDQLVESGWRGDSGRESSSRIRDLAAVEEVAHMSLSPGICDRWKSVYEKLPSFKTDLEIYIVGEMSDFSGLVAKVLGCLNVKKMDGYAVEDHSCGPKDSDLYALQEALSKKGKIKKWNGDGTVVFLKGSSESLLAKGLGAWIVHKMLNDENSVIVCSENQTDLDEGLRSQNLSQTGGSSSSKMSPVSQVLPLYLSLIWEPLDPYKLLEFLTHPIGPMPKWFKKHFADAVAEKPGIGNISWNEAIVKARSDLKKFEEKAKDEDNSHEEGSKKFDIDETLKRWVTFERHDPSKGVPLSILIKQCQNLSSWARIRSGTEQNDLRQAFMHIKRDADSLLEFLDGFKGIGERVSKVKLDRILEQVVSDYADDSVTSELGHVPVCKHPSALLDSKEYIIWWHFVHEKQTNRLPWCEAEKSDLCSLGVDLPTSESRFSSEARSWLLPVLRTKKQIVFVIPTYIDGEEVNPHQLWDEIVSAFDVSLPVVNNIEQLLAKETKSAFDFSKAIFPSLEKAGYRALPTPIRWWKIKCAHLLSSREEESYSSIDSLVQRPYHWVLNYKALLKKPRIHMIPDGRQIYGIIAHRVLEEIFDREKGLDWKKAKQDTVDKWIEKTLSNVIKDEACHLLLPGRALDLEILDMTIPKAAWSLIGFLRRANVKEITLEKKITADFKEAKLTGYIDVLVKNIQDLEGVIDLKWGGSKFRETSLKGGQQIQLAVYGAARKQETGVWPAYAYFMIEDQKLLAHSDSFFNGAQIVSSKSGEDCEDLWKRLLLTWSWRRAQLDRGLIEVLVTGTTPDSDSKPPDGSVELPDVCDQFNDYKSLTGWEEGV